MNPWDERYASEDFYYGLLPNDWLKQTVSHINPGGRVLCLAEGEGRNATYLASLGFKVVAMDQSVVGLKKAAALAEQRGVAIDTVYGDLANYDLGQAQWDAVVSISAHTPPEIRQGVHGQLVDALVPGGIFVLQAYQPKQPEMPGIGGPPARNRDWFMTLDGLTRELNGLEIVKGIEEDCEVNEGAHHQGLSAVVRVLARKPYT